jgi:FkbM family methyltransferase
VEREGFDEINLRDTQLEFAGEIKSHVNGKMFKYIDNEWTMDYVGRTNHHEFETNSKLLELIKNTPNNSYIIDAGAHVGDTSLLLARELKDLNIKSKIIAVDPTPGKIQFIEKMASLNKLGDYIETYNVGISDKDGKGSLDKRYHPGAWYISEGNDFDITSLDKLVPKKRIYLIKLDVEGFEYNALIGALGIIRKYHPILIIEIIESTLQRGGSSSVEIFELLQKEGYTKTWSSSRSGDQDACFEYS